MTMFNPPHPGEVLYELIIRDEEGTEINSVAAAAKAIGVHRSTLNRVLRHCTAITPEMALALETFGAGSAEHWLKMQNSYDLHRLRQQEVA